MKDTDLAKTARKVDNELLRVVLRAGGCRRLKCFYYKFFAFTLL